MVGNPSSMIDLIEKVSRKEVGDFPRISTEVWETEVTRKVARRYIVIVKNMGVFIFSFELGIAKKFFLNIDPDFFYTNGPRCSVTSRGGVRRRLVLFYRSYSVVLDVEIEIADFGPRVKNDPPSKHA